MQVSARSEQHQGPPGPPPAVPPVEYLRTRRSVTKAAQGLESVQQLAIASEAGWRTPWVLPPIGKRWREPISARLMLTFLGWLLEGSVRPSWAKGGLVVMDGQTRTLIGSIEDRDADGQGVAGDWARLLRCSARQARRCIHLAQRLGLVEQIRNRLPQLRAKCEQPAAYLPTEKLLAWLRDRKPAEDLFELPPEKTKCPTPRSPRVDPDVAEDLLRPEGLHEAGHRAPEKPSRGSAKAEPELVGTVPGGRAAAPVGVETSARPLRLLPACLSARPAAPPAEEQPPGGDLFAEFQSLARSLVGRLDRDAPGELPPDELERRRRVFKARFARSTVPPDPDGGSGGGGAA